MPASGGAGIARARKARTARLAAIKADILNNLADPDLSVSAVALRQCITRRYVHMLFEAEGITFSEFVLERRLTQAYHMLSDPGNGAKTIAALAYAAGFGDLSYFNRTFRRRFGAKPSEVRYAPVP
jgi:AraC-like DNA-binding protein